MQTFLPHPDFTRSAELLDDRRLGKQRVETLQILRALHFPGYGWAHHPAVLMWRGHTAALVSYGIAMVETWVARGYSDTTRANIAEFVHPERPREQDDLAEDELPPWLGWEVFHASHRSTLLRKDPVRYREDFPETPADLDHVWPDPPREPDDPGPVDAWAVRGSARDDRVELALDGARLDVGSGRRTKRDRELLHFTRDIEVGEVLVVPDGDRVTAALVDGPLRSIGHRVFREVRWIGTVNRGDLRFPAALQDPGRVFPLHDEPAVRELAAHA